MTFHSTEQTQSWRRVCLSVFLILLLVSFLSYLITDDHLTLKSSHQAHQTGMMANQVAQPYHDQTVIDEGKKEEKMSTCERKKTNIAMVKTHKCVSDLMGTMMLRFGEKHNLEILLPKQGGSNLGYGPDHSFNNAIPSRLKSGKYQMMALHTMYNYTNWTNIMEHPFDLVGLVREPLAQFQSYFSYYKFAEEIQLQFTVDPRDSFDFFIRRYPEQIGGQLPHRIKHYPLINTMLYDYGARGLTRPEQFKSLIGQIMRNFTVILVAEMFDESLVVLKHKLCWDWSDVAYVTTNQGKYKFEFRNETLLEERRGHHRRFAPYEYMFYSASLDKLKADIKIIPNFFDQLLEMRSVRRKITEWCYTNKTSVDSITIKTKFSKTDQTVFRKQDCTKMRMKIVDYTIKLIQDRYHYTPTEHWDGEFGEHP